MNTNIRPVLLFFVVMAGLGGCSGVATVASDVTASVGHIASRVAHPFTPAAPASSPAGLDAYQAQVAQRVAERNPEHRYTGALPPMLPAIVVLDVTVDADGRMTDVEVRRSRDPAASKVALASMRRSAPLPPPRKLAAGTGRLTFSETFLFADAERYQLRSLAEGQRGE
jgi:protein TonB